MKDRILIPLSMAALFVSAMAFGQSTPRTSQKYLGNGVSYERWINEDVKYIATDQEKADFAKLTSNEARDRFIEQFWAKRNPTPRSEENPFKKEHYRRIAYSNEHFAATVAGWKTDRGRIYIVYGPPEWIKDQPTKASDPPAQLWHYAWLPGVGEDMNAKGEITLRFVDSCQCNDYRLTLPDSINVH